MRETGRAISSAFKLCIDEKTALCCTPTHLQQIRLAADLTIFHVLLMAAGRLVDKGIVPLPATRALIDCFGHCLLPPETGAAI